MEGALVAVMAKVEGVVIKNCSGGFASRPPQILYYFLASPKSAPAVLGEVS